LSLAPIEQLLLYLSGWVSVVFRYESQHIGMTRSAGFTPANQILAFQFPANITDRERKRSSDQISPIKGHGFFCGMMACSKFVWVSPFRRSANVDSFDWMPPASRSSPLDSRWHCEDLRYAYLPPISPIPELSVWCLRHHATLTSVAFEPQGVRST